ncbi:MAG: sll0787 family AIR synthase-like protein [Janthinobacterium lividum]
MPALAARVRASRGVAHKQDIAGVVQRLGNAAPGAKLAVPMGDDCAALCDPSGSGYLLFAIEGFVNDFVAAEPWFAGYCGVMVNVSDIYAMGGRPTAVVDALWARDGAPGDAILDGLAAASRVYGVPIVGGHSNRRCDREQLSVSIIGRALRLLSSFAARPGQHLLAAIDLRGHFHEPFPYWDASSGSPAERLRGDLEILPILAEAGLCGAAKDISMAGIVGTALMFAECSGVGVSIDVAAIPRPAGVALSRWLEIFPSFGFLLAVDDAALDEVRSHFETRGIATGVLGRFDTSRRVHLTRDAAVAEVWNFAQQALIGCAVPAAPVPADGART